MVPGPIRGRELHAMSDTAQEYADAIAQEVADLNNALTTADRYCYGGEGDAPTFDGTAFSDPFELISYYFDACALEVLDVTARSWASRSSVGERRFVEVLRTFGGPNVRVYFKADDFVTVRAHWGTDEGVARVLAPRAVQEVWAHADAVAECYA